MTCNDKDSGPNGDCFISIIIGDDASPKFSVSGTQLQTSTNTIDFETLTNRTFFLVVIGKDKPLSGSPKTGTANVFITIEGVNEFSPTFASNSNVSIKEDVVLGSVVTQYTATDKDKGIDGDLKYDIQSGINVCVFVTTLLCLCPHLSWIHFASNF